MLFQNRHQRADLHPLCLLHRHSLFIDEDSSEKRLVQAAFLDEFIETDGPDAELPV